MLAWLQGIRFWLWLRWELVRPWVYLQLQRLLTYVARRMVDWSAARMMEAAARDEYGRDFEFWMQQHRGWKERLQRSRINLGRFREHLSACTLWVHCLRAVPLRILPYMVERSLQSLDSKHPVRSRQARALSQLN